jgi:hypothetical protein
MWLPSGRTDRHIQTVGPDVPGAEASDEPYGLNREIGKPVV